MGGCSECYSESLLSGWHLPLQHNVKVGHLLAQKSAPWALPKGLKSKHAPKHLVASFQDCGAILEAKHIDLHMWDPSRMKRSIYPTPSRSENWKLVEVEAPALSNKHCICPGGRGCKQVVNVKPSMYQSMVPFLQPYPLHGTCECLQYLAHADLIGREFA